MARLKRHHAAEAESSHGIDLAPMLDFVLNLLIFFIIIAVFVKESGMLVNRPTPGEPPKDAPQSITVLILENGEVWVDERAVDPRAVSANIERLHAEDSKRGVMVQAHPKAHSGLLITVVDEIHLGGVWNITFATGG